MISAFYYDGLSRRERQSMHARAGSFYEHESPEPFRAALHYQQAGESMKAAQQATADIRQAIGHGHIQPMRQLLERFGAGQLDQSTWVAVNVALGQIYPQIDEWALAKARFETALDSIKTMPDALPDTLRHHAEACFGMATIAERSSFDDATSWVKRGLAHLGRAEPLLAAALHIKRAGLCAVLGDFEMGVRAIKIGQKLLAQRASQDPHVLQVAALENLGALYFHQGYAKEAGAQWEKSLTLCRQLPDPFKAVNLLNNLGAFNLVAGDWSKAERFLKEGLAESEQIGLLLPQCGFHVNLGILAIWQGQDKAAEEHLMAFAEQTSEFGTNALYGLADLKLRQQKLAEGCRSAHRGRSPSPSIGDKLPTDRNLHPVGATQHGRRRLTHGRKICQASTYPGPRIRHDARSRHRPSRPRRDTGRTEPARCCQRRLPRECCTAGE